MGQLAVGRPFLGVKDGTQTDAVDQRGNGFRLERDVDIRLQHARVLGRRKPSDQRVEPVYVHGTLTAVQSGAGKCPDPKTEPYLDAVAAFPVDGHRLGQEVTNVRRVAFDRTGHAPVQALDHEFEGSQHHRILVGEVMCNGAGRAVCLIADVAQGHRIDAVTCNRLAGGRGNGFPSLVVVDNPWHIFTKSPLHNENYIIGIVL